MTDLEAIAEVLGVGVDDVRDAAQRLAIRAQEQAQELLTGVHDERATLEP